MDGWMVQFSMCDFSYKNSYVTGDKWDKGTVLLSHRHGTRGRFSCHTARDFEGTTGRQGSRKTGDGVVS